MLAMSIFRKLGILFKKVTRTGGKPISAPVIPPQHPPTARREQERHAKRGIQPQSERGHRETRRPHPDRQTHSLRTPRTKHEPTAEPHQPEVKWNAAEFNVPPDPEKVRFHDLGLPVEVMHAIHDLGFQYCTPIQAGILAHTLSGKDATGRAQTGTGKTAAFLITILTRFSRTPAPKPRKKGAPRALILAPTRELVLQIEKDAKSFTRYTSHKAMAVFGGMEYGKQQNLLKSSADIVAATPGRLLDFKRKGYIDLSQVEILVIDEADRMLDMGFIPDVRRIIESTPMKGTRQTLFFSATLTPEVNRLAAAWTRQPVLIDVTPSQEITLSAIEQMVYISTDDEKFTLLYNMITKRNLERVMLFANRRDETQFLKDLLESRGIRCGLLSGDVSQAQRGKTLEAFRNGRFKVLVATDVAARGLHIQGVSHVVNYSLPMDAQDYVHRIGRTGRAGASGISISFATETEAYQLPEIEKYIGRKLVAIHPEQDLLTPLPALAEGVVEPKKRASRMPQGRSSWSRARPRSGHGRGRSGGGNKS
jgi:ATP-dependent RNA helicase RhlB